MTVRFLAKSLILGVLAVGPTMARAQVVCANCQTEVTGQITLIETIRNAIVTAYMEARQAQMWATQQMQWVNQQVNTLSLPYYLWNDVQGAVNMARALGRLPNMFVNGAGFNIAALPSYISQLQMPLLTVGQWQNMYERWSERGNSAIASTLRAFGQHEDNMAADTVTRKLVETQIQTADGQKQAMQASGSATLLLAAQMQKQRQAELTHYQAEANYRQQQLEKEMTTQAAITQMMDVPDLDMNGNPRYNIGGP